MPARREPKLGEKFNSWTYLGEYDKRKWKCQCDCGAIHWPNACHVRSGASESCRSCGGDRNKLHGMLDHPVYATWMSIKTRCYNAAHQTYSEYGGSGITMYPPWRSDFLLFFAYVGEKPSAAHTMDRVDNEKGYFPGNVRWATPKEQARNRRNNKWLTFDGETLCVTDWCLRVGITAPCAYNRVKTMGWTWEEAVKTPHKGLRYTSAKLPLADSFANNVITL